MRTVKQLREALSMLTGDELIQAKWREERILSEIKREMEARDARTVDAACKIKIGDAA